ncbi:MAG: RNA methyltransferase [Desulfobacterales bacterium]|nr:RNA methyltransferase [Desulfobacterales bacterium]
MSDKIRQDAFQKRMKRTVIARQHNFFAVVSPGFLDVCYSELCRIQNPPIEQIEKSTGGVSFVGYLHDAYYLNLMSRTATRILMRIAEFKAVHFKELEHKLSDIPWEYFLISSNPLYIRIHVSTSKSKLYHKSAIAERIYSSIAARFLSLSHQSTNESIQTNSFTTYQNIFGRMVNDRFTVSIDTSGDLLYKRGIKRFVGKAPLRETTAAAILYKAGYTPGMPLIDPMCGSGTFSIEAAMISKSIPPGWFRNFAFMQWPCFREKRWQYLKRVAGENRIRFTRPHIVSLDIDELASNILKQTILDFSLSDVIQVIHDDFFNISPRDFFDKPGLVMINPPYGIRLKEHADMNAFITSVGNRLVSHYHGWRAALILPRHMSSPITSPHHVFPFVHGGLDMNLVCFKIQ